MKLSTGERFGHVVRQHPVSRTKFDTDLLSVDKVGDKEVSDVEVS
jgi:hypothetical protein